MIEHRSQYVSHLHARVLDHWLPQGARPKFDQLRQTDVYIHQYSFLRAFFLALSLATLSTFAAVLSDTASARFFRNNFRFFLFLVARIFLIFFRPPDDSDLWAV